MSKCVRNNIEPNRLNLNFAAKKKWRALKKYQTKKEMNLLILGNKELANMWHIIVLTSA